MVITNFITLLKNYIIFLLSFFIFVSTGNASITNSLQISSEKFGDSSKLEAIGLTFNNINKGCVKVLVKKENFKEGFQYHNDNEKNIDALKYSNNLHIYGKWDNKFFIYSPSLKKCKMDFKILSLDLEKQVAEISLSVSLLNAKKNVNKIKAPMINYKIEGKDFLALKKLLPNLETKKIEINYQELTNNLRESLINKNIVLKRGDIQYLNTHKKIVFQTNTEFEVKMTADNNNILMNSKINLSNLSKDNKSKVIDIISTIMYLSDEKKENILEYKELALRLFEGIDENKQNMYTLNSYIHTLNGKNCYEVRTK